MDEQVKHELIASLQALKAGHSLESLAAANSALSLLARAKATDAESTAAPGASIPLLARAYHRKASALLALDDPVEAVRVYREGVKACHGSEHLGAGLRLALDALPPRWHAAYWSSRVEAGEAARPYSSRDGTRLRRVPPERWLTKPEVAAALCAAFEARPETLEEAKDLAVSAWVAGRKELPRCALAYLRGWAYLEHGDHDQAMADGKVAVVYGPRTEVTEESLVETPAAEEHEEDGSDWMEGLPWLRAAIASQWPAVLVLLSSAYEASGNNVRATLLAALAAEACPPPETAAAPHSLVATAALDRLAARIPEECAKAVAQGGSAALLRLLSQANLASKPEIHRRRPKYYYYYEWMKKRIHQQYPALPEPVMDKLLTIDANELDLVLQYPKATQHMVDNLVQVLEEEGSSSLETYRVPLLSWEDVKALKGPDTVGLPLAASEDQVEAPPTPNRLPLSAPSAATDGPDEEDDDARAVSQTSTIRSTAALGGLSCPSESRGEDELSVTEVEDTTGALAELD